MEPVIITSCAFCGRKFSHVWNYQLVSCLHMYHSWCIVAHFSISTKCLVMDYNQDIHLDWWARSEISKPREKLDDHGEHK